MHFKPPKGCADETLMSPAPVVGTPADQTPAYRRGWKRLLALLTLILLIPTGLVVGVTQYDAAQNHLSNIPALPTPTPDRTPNTTSKTSTTHAPVRVSSVSLTNDQTQFFDATPLFDEKNLDPGASGVSCIEVRYTGKTPNGAHLTFSVDDTSGFAGLDQYLSFTIVAGSGIAYGANPQGTCSGFTAGTGSHVLVLYNTLLDTPSTSNSCFTSSSSCRIWDYGAAKSGTSIWQTNNVTDYEIHWAVSPNTPTSGFSWTATQAS